MSYFSILFVVLTGLILSGFQSTSSVVKRSQMLMGTLVFVTAVAQDENTAQEAAEAGLSEIQRLEKLLSTWIPESELSQVNASAGENPVSVSRDTLEVLERSLEMAILTRGGFNIMVGPAVSVWRASQEGQLPSDQELTDILPLTDLSSLKIKQEDQTVFLTKKGMQVDIGGIGKGFAADLAARKMQAAGATAGVVALSGDIKTFGLMPDGQKFLFGIQHPRKEQGQLLARLELENEAVSTAGDYQRFFIRDNVRYHHILDPRTLKPARSSQSATVIAKEGVVADGLDTGIFVMGSEQGIALVESLPGVEAVIVDEKGEIWISSGLQGRLQIEESPSPTRKGFGRAR